MRRRMPERSRGWATTTRRVRHDSAISTQMVLKSSRTPASAVGSLTPEPALPMAIPAWATARARASLTSSRPRSSPTGTTGSQTGPPGGSRAVHDLGRRRPRLRRGLPAQVTGASAADPAARRFRRYCFRSDPPFFHAATLTDPAAKPPARVGRRRKSSSRRAMRTHTALPAGGRVSPAHVSTGTRSQRPVSLGCLTSSPATEREDDRPSSSPA